ncbi:helix-turn-helix transcriptional regulator [Thermococcus thioreducens]|uniref:Transcriptional regulator n=1 Tax=Thermococcus thioreducens TaxID=277988 RepID=A0A0Q2ULR8_9EURY|nr:helix-turn-helix transcriptional regulator [Thermococcus thioreducens]ASJ13074.1 transcriptional regulator [Thermococcus thioreducens]KQH81584.1 XRE family transcriptional regulator [Thermococcus thioreducens]SEV81539.1 putative transcriptional regulator [Thermococcus thioreducens]
MKNRLRELREDLGITQEELAKALGVTRQTIIAIEKGRYDPSLRLAFKIARFFNRRIEEIFIYEEGQKDAGRAKNAHG